MSTGGEVANALVCKTSIRGFNSRPVLQYVNKPSHLTLVQLSLQGLKHEDNLLLKP